MGCRSYPARCHNDFAWITFGIGDELRKRVGRNRWIHHHDVGLAVDSRNRRDVVKQVETEFVVDQCAGYSRRADEQERITIWGRFHNRLTADSTTGTWPVLHNKWLA